MHPVNAAVLAQGGGKYRCAKCHKTGNALEALFDEWPQASQQATRPGELPELGLALSLGTARESETAVKKAALPGGQVFDEEPDSPPQKSWQRAVWVGSALVLAVIITLNLLRFFQLSPVERSTMQSAMVSLGLRQAPPQQPFRAPEQIQLLSRELKAHPYRPGVLQLTATIVNRADRVQPYPDIEVTMLDIHSRQLARQLFKPGDYLTGSAGLRDGMAVEAYLTLTLELPDPGNDAVGYELQIR